MRASPGGPDTESAPAGTPRTSARNLTLAGPAVHVAPSVPLETRGFAWYEGRRQCRKLRIQRLSRDRCTSRTGTFFEAHRLAKRVLDLHVAEREPFLKSGAEQQVMETAKVEGQDRLCHIIPLQ